MPLFIKMQYDYFLVISRKWQSCSSIWERDETLKRDSAEERSDGDGDAAESVNCPVCGARLPGADNALINSHVGKV